jgi:hypothetical protein
MLGEAMKLNEIKNLHPKVDRAPLSEKRNLKPTPLLQAAMKQTEAIIKARFATIDELFNDLEEASKR